ncbi:MAG: autoantigen p27 domain-containing protein [Methanoregula sp.]|jgi:UPF0148 protein
MPVRKEDEIMAEYLLKGGKMLEKSCKTCGCPLFEVKGKTLCVVCEENEPPARKENKSGAEKDSTTPAGHECTCPAGEPPEECLMLADDLANTILALCERIRNEKDPDHVLTLMSAVKTGAESLHILCQL